MTTKITVLVDNKAENGLLSEHGLAFLIEHKGKRLLFDNGQNEALFFNAEKLNITLNNIDIIILSHGHYDHGGNLKALLLANPNADFYAHPDCLQTRYSLHKGKAPRTISLSEETIEAIKAFPDKQTFFITQPTEVIEDLWLTGEIPRLSEVEDTGGPFFLDKEKKQVDLIADDMSLYIKTEQDMTVICGCCHSGIINTLDFIKKKTDNSTTIKYLIGGLHLLNANKLRLQTTISYLNQANINNLYAAHCTGDNTMLLLFSEFKNNFFTVKAGLNLTL